MTSTNRFALLDKTQLTTLSKLRGLPEQDTAEDMITALDEQSAADRADEAKWLTEKATRDAATPAAATSTPHTPVRTVSWADDAQEEADAIAEAAAKAEAEADVGSESDLEAGWETVVKRSPRQKKVDEAAGGSQGSETAEEVEVEAVLPLTPTKMELEGKSEGQAEGLQTDATPPANKSTARPPPSVVDHHLADEVTEAVGGSPSAGTTDEDVTPSESTVELVDKAEEANESFSKFETASDNAEPVNTNPGATPCASLPDWDDYIASMPAVFAPSQQTPEPVSSASSSARPLYVVATASEVRVSKATTADTKQEVVKVAKGQQKEEAPATPEQVMATSEAVPTTPTKRPKRRGGKKARRRGKLQTVTSGPAKDADAAGAPSTPIRQSSPTADPVVVEFKGTTTSTQVSSPLAAYPTLASTPISEEIQDGTAAETPHNSPIEFESIYRLANLLNAATADLNEFGKGASRLRDQETKPDAEFTQESIGDTSIGNDVDLHSRVLGNSSTRTQKKNLRRREQRKMVRHTAAVAENSEVTAAPLHGNGTAAEEKKKPSGAQGRKEATAAARAASAHPFGFQLSGCYVPWFVALALFMSQLLVIVVVIYLLM
ncbi:hypothetical protein EJ07DRAFT_159395 [Lizonia empirigonia]|nr:hypothetical protein EJ07DRAFT_159395 [Lizonia empirigonia]